MSELPETLHLGPMDYTLDPVQDLRHRHEKVDGHVSYHETAIYVEAQTGEQCQRATIWHEVLHVILAQAGYPEHDEAQLEVLAHGIMDALRRNPWLRGDA